MENKDVWINANEAKEILGVHLNTLYDWCRGGLIPCYQVKPRSAWRFKKKEVEEFFESMS